ncbi:TetR family transcriptional regulator [Tropicimonas sp. IMCC6043]|uniref:TetR family transcriptional regulator n=1 Tax=Tropicimonas sp. IMCC6043 TaxID=2510645 RepID=UPI00101CB348|nr:TetR family transcriptional regulator [Tropicimonas sp. IMCC6043]RYH08286.1 TetR family transcriptional regulator [Tropicimonas sp. IMCC6043]
MRIERIKRRPGTRDAEATRAAILDAARAEFAENGLGGGRIDAIADRAGINKAMIYHYFGSKDALFAEVLQQNYALIRAAEAKLELARLEPAEAVGTFVEFSFDYVAANPEFIKLLNEENLHGGRHLNPDLARQLNSPVVAALSDVLARGVESGLFRKDVDPQHLYITIASICYFPVSNRCTLSAIFDLPLGGEMLNERRRQATEVIFGYLRP